MCQAFWQPSLPFLARNTPAAIEARRALAAGEIDDVEYEKRQTLQHNKLSNVAFGSMSLGYTIVLVIALGAAFALGANDSTEANTRAAVIIVGIATGFWILFGTPWFFLEKPRTRPLPPGGNYLSMGAKAYWGVICNGRGIGQVWLYLVGYFFLSDGHATAIQVVNICMNSVISYDTILNTELSLVQGIANFVGIVLFWVVQRHWRFQTKPMLLWIAGFNVLIPVWGKFFFSSSLQRHASLKKPISTDFCII
jgi:MFS-type transporter involved in bile tolerance (Atg22 family)